MTKVLVTGHAGFIGTYLTRRLIKEGCQVNGLDNYTVGSKNRVSGVNEYEGDVRNINDIKKAANGCEVIFHLAAQSSVPKSTEELEKDFRTNTQGTINVLKVAIDNEIEVINASTSTVYGKPNQIPTPEEEQLKPISPYGASKASAEMYCNALNNTHNLDVKTLRLFNVYGPRNTKGVMWDFFNKLTRNPKELEILGTGKQEKDYIYIEDAIKAFIEIWREGKPGEAYNVGTGNTLTVNEIADKISGIMDINPEYRYTGGKSWKGDVEKTKADISKLKKLGWKPKTPANKGIEKTYKWFRNQKKET